MRYFLSLILLSLPSLAMAEACPDAKARAALALASASCECSLTGICTCQHCGCAIQVKLPEAKPVKKPDPFVTGAPVSSGMVCGPNGCVPVSQVGTSTYAPAPTYYAPTYSPVSSYGASFGGSCGPGGCSPAPAARVGIFRRR